MRYKLFVVVSFVLVWNGLCENYNTPQRNPTRGFVTNIIKYLDAAFDFLFQAIFGEETRPPSDDEDGEFEKVSYKGFHLFRVWPRTDDAVENLKSLGQQPRVQLWLPPMKNASVDVVLPPNMVRSIKNELEDQDIEYSVISSDIEKIISSQTTARSKQKWRLKNDKPAKMTWTEYHPLADIFNYLDHLQSTYSDIADVITIGKSTEGRELKVLRISAGKSNSGATKPAIWIDGGIHAREWISTAVALFIIRQLVEFHKSYKNLVDSLDWYILPVANPDGYEFTHTTDRLWRKSRSSNDEFSGRYFWEGNDCKGVDLNRNWDFRWNEDGDGDYPCHETYAGRSAFSEPETRAMSNFILEHRDEIIIYLSLHSYSQTWLMPWYSAKGKSNDYDDLLYMGRKAIEALKKTHGTNYNLVAKQTTLHLSSGSSDEWVKNKVGIKYCYMIELRDKGTYGFLLPPTQILPTSKEIFTAIRTLTRSILNNVLKHSTF